MRDPDFPLLLQSTPDVTAGTCLENGKFVQTSWKSYATHIEARRAAQRIMQRLSRKPATYPDA